jgi:CHAT domain-containing protein
MGWALFVAGSPTAVLSLWKVESASTAELMVGFHRNLTAPGAGRRKAEALRAASLELMKDRRYRHPFYWAGFVMTGNGM